jgi:enoyl-CoA hydratase/carnithine racemase
MMLVLTGEMISAREACEMGLVSRVVADGEVVAHAVAMAKGIAQLPPISVAFAKEAVIVGEDAPLATALSVERKALWLLFATEDQKEGMGAFLEKRAPTFKGQ